MAEITGVEIFGEGVWNGNKITAQTLSSIVKSFEATKDFVKPILKLGHNEEQKLLAEDGLPNAGIVSNVYIRGKKLLADFIDIPDKVYQLIKKKAYRKVSVEIFNGYSFDGKEYPSLLGAVALLGADMPAVMTLSDILDRYSKVNFTKGEKADVTIYTSQILEEGDEDMSTEQKPSAAEKKLEELQAKIEKFSADFEKTKEENDKLKTDLEAYKKQADEKIATLEAQKTEAEVEKFSISLKAKGLVSPSMEPYVKALVGSSKTEFSVGEKKFSTGGLIEELLSLAKKVYSTNLTENSQDIEPEKKDTAAAKEKEIEEYMKANPKVSYRDAYSAVMRASK